jgi:hypothetical protein
MLPVNIAAQLQLHLQNVKLQHKQDLADRFGEVWLPDALARKYPRAAREWSWQFVFPSRISIDSRTQIKRRHHIDETALQQAVKRAGARCWIKQAGKLSYISTFLRNPSPRKRLRYSHRAGVVRP